MLHITPLTELHKEAGAKMCPFAGYEMPVQYKLGIVNEHEWVREHAGLFDVSHMGQMVVKGANAANWFSAITPSPFGKTPISRAKYTVLTNDEGGIIDDLIISRLSDDTFFVVYNAGCKEKDEAHFNATKPDGVTISYLKDNALIALQGPEAAKLLQQHISGIMITNMPYMTVQQATLKDGTSIIISRLGYTGEDGFEISVPADAAVTLWQDLAAHQRIEPVGLGARDSLRLEMGYPLYGNDLDDTTSPIEAGLAWVVGKTNAGFAGENRIRREQEQGTTRKRVGVELVDKGVARHDAPILNASGDAIGILTSGGYSPTLKRSIGQGYVKSHYAEEAQDIYVEVRGRAIAAKVTSFNFLEPNTVSSTINKDKNTEAA